MSLDKLPEELLIIILRQLELKSICSLYDTGNRRLQDVICLQGVLKECRLTSSSMATVQTFKLDFFKGISKNIQELNISAIPDLTKSTLLPAIKKMKNLVSLNVAYTNITIFDLLELYELCPIIKNITVNFQFHKPNAKINHFSLETLTKCQDLFANFENVHFIGSYDNLLNSNLPLCMLQKAKINSLTYTIAQDKMFTYYKYVEKKPFFCNKFTLNMLYWKEKSFRKVIYALPDIFDYLAFEYEFIHLHDCKYTVSPVFTNYFMEHFKFNRVNFKPKLFCSLLDGADHIIRIWNKQTTIFDDSFFREVDSEIKSMMPCVVTYAKDMDPVLVKNDWVCLLHPLIPEMNDKKYDDFLFKRKRHAAPNVVLDYDDMFEDKQDIKLTICFYDHIQRPVTLSAKSIFLRNLTFLQLKGAVRYSSDFFNILFRCCNQLSTLDVEGYSISPCAPPISRSIPLNRSIKNLRIVDKNIDLNSLFSSLSQCSKLENVVIIDASKGYSELPSLDALLKQCDNLYYLCIGGSVKDISRTRKPPALNKVKHKYNRHHLFIEVINEVHPEYCYDPFIDVFKSIVKLNSIA